MAVFTVLEQYLVELINRARADPAAEAARYGIGLNQGLAPGTISAASKEPLEVHAALLESSDGHSADMVANDYFSHTGLDGSTPTERMFAAGWGPRAGSSWRTGENIAARFTTGSDQLASQHNIDVQHEGLFLSEGHRENILGAYFSEIGVGQQFGDYAYQGTYYQNASLVTENFADGGRTYITGVVIADADGDGFYDIGEGLGNVAVTVAGGGISTSGATSATGGYSIAVPSSGSFQVTFSGGGLSGSITKSASLVGSNVKIDALASEASHAPVPAPTPVPAPAPAPPPAPAPAVDLGEDLPGIDGISALDYVASYPDLVAAFGGLGSAVAIATAGEAHFLRFGAAEGRLLEGRAYFDGAQYAQNYGDLGAAFGTGAGADEAGAAAHYIKYGAAEGRLAYDATAYVASYPDLMSALGTDEAAAVRHWSHYGRAEGRGVSFDAQQYLDNYADLAGRYGDDNGAGAAFHFVSWGGSEGRSDIDPLDYVASHDDLIAAYDADRHGSVEAFGLWHYRAFGQSEGRGVDFDAWQYLQNYPDVQAAYVRDVDAAALHFIRWGHDEGRTDDLLV